MHKIRILHVYPTIGFGGAERLLVDIVTNTNPAHFEHCVVYLAPPEDYASALQQRARVLEPLGWSGKRDWLRMAREVARIEREWKPDVIHSCLFEANIAARLSRLFGSTGRLLTSVVSLDYEPRTVRATGVNRRKVALRRLCDLTTSRLTSVYHVACSRCVEYSMMRDLGVPRHQRETIYNCIDPTTIESSFEERCEFRRSIGVPQEAFVYLNVSRHQDLKRQITAIRAFHHVEKQQPDALLVLVGGGPMHGTLRRTTHELGLTEKVRFVGVQPSVAPSLASGDVFIFPSAVEGLSLALLEAMYSGLCCLASDIPANLEVVEHGRTGLVFQVDAHESLAEQMRLVYENRNLRGALAVEGARFVGDNFLSRQVIPRWESLYRRLSQSGQ